MVSKQLWDRDEFLAEVRERRLQAQDIMKSLQDQRCRNVIFVVDDWVCLRLHRRTESGITATMRSKLDPHFYEPYQVSQRIGTVSYRLRLPTKAHIHDVFHVSLLKKFEGLSSAVVPPLPNMYHDRVLPTPHTVVRARLNRG